jgi:hypothetical protein
MLHRIEQLSIMKSTYTSAPPQCQADQPPPNLFIANNGSVPRYRGTKSRTATTRFVSLTVHRVPEFIIPEDTDTEHKDIEPFVTFPPPEGPGSNARNSTTGPHEGQSGDDDFDDRAAQFWAVYVKEARGHDEALIGTWKDDMEGVIIFVRFLLSIYASKPVLNVLSTIRLVYTRPP